MRVPQDASWNRQEGPQAVLNGHPELARVGPGEPPRRPDVCIVFGSVELAYAVMRDEAYTWPPSVAAR